MNCNCMKEIEGKILKTHPEWNGKKVVSVRMEKTFTFEPEIDMRTSTNVVIEVEGQNKKYDIGMTHTYCPFCGIKQTKE
jgi:hypothetical protein